MADFIRNHLSSIKAYLTIHSYSQMMLYPYSYDYKLPKNNVELVSHHGGRYSILLLSCFFFNSIPGGKKLYNFWKVHGWTLVTEAKQIYKESEIG